QSRQLLRPKLSAGGSSDFRPAIVSLSSQFYARASLNTQIKGMPSASLTRRVSFSAAHRYSRPEWSDEKNTSTFGACAWPNFHGHSYVCDVTVSGPIDDKTGFVVDLGVLDAILKAEVRDRFDHRNINLD